MASKGRKGSGAKTVVALAILAVLAGGVWVFTHRSTPERTVRQYLEAEARGDKEAVKACLSESSRSMVEKIEKTMPNWSGLSGAKGGAEATPQHTIGKATIKGDNATVPVTAPLPEQVAKLTGMKELNMEFGLVKERGTWKVDLEATMAAMMRQMSNMMEKHSRPK